MSWVATAVIAGGLLGVGGSYIGAKGNNKRLKSSMLEFKPYNGLKPPAVDTEGYKSFRPVQQMITETLMRRSQGNDVGFDPERRELLRKKYDLERLPIEQKQMRDITNYLSGAGLSRNVRARDKMIGDTQEEFGRARDLYATNMDIEDLTRRNQERDVNTARLQALNQMNFGQENQRAQFDLAQYGAEESARLGIGGLNAGINQAMSDPWGDAVSGGLSGAMLAYGLSNPASSMATTTTQPKTVDMSSVYGPSGYGDMTKLIRRGGTAPISKSRLGMFGGQ